MIVGVCTVELSLPGNHSLKEKRSVIKPLLAGLRREFNVSAAEVDDHDAWQTATLGLAVVSSAKGNVHGLLEQCVRWLERAGPWVHVTRWDIEVL